ncbi:MAG TPA: CBS domain-containing protein [Bryobacteraceae bacterium]|nr:CBS domain-containing protein [Bryobacteraceae bacterium]
MSETMASVLKTKGNAIWSIVPDATVYDAIALMANKGIGALLALSGGRLDGIISERDYARKVILEGRSSKDTLVREIMTRPVVTVTPEDTVDICMKIVTERRIRHLPVVDRDNIVGIVSIGDLVRATIAAQAETIDHLHTYILGTTYPS